MPPLLVETYSTAAERLALNAFRIGDINGLDSVQAGVVQRSEVPRRVRAPVRAARVPPSAERRRSEAVFGRVHRAGAREPPLHRRRARRGRSDAAVAELPVPRRSRARRQATRTTTSPAGCRTCCGTRCRTRRCSRRRRRASCSTPAGRERAARRMLENAPKGREALDQFFEEWLRFDRVVNAVKAQPVSGVHAGAGAGDGRGDAHAAASPRVERSQLHGSADGRLQLPHVGACRGVRRAGAEGSVRDGEIPSRLEARGHSRPGHVPRVDGGTDRHVADGARHLHSRAAALPARAASAARRHHDAARSARRSDSRRDAGS